MPHVADRELKTLIRNVADPKLRKHISDVISGQVAFRVVCTRPQKDQQSPDGTKHPANMVIGHIYTNGRAVPVPDDDGRMWMRSYRDRLDGNRGFKCWCGNDSIKAKEEQGVIGPSVPTKDDLETVFGRVQDKPSYPVRNGTQLVDGFRIERV